MGYPMKAVSVVVAATTLVLSLSACGSGGVPSSDEQRKAAMSELEKRGFQDPVFVTDEYGGPDEMRFTAQLDDCRIFISRTEGGRFSYRDTSWTDQQLKQVAEINGGSVSDVVNASFIRTHGDELGWAHCLTE